MTSEDKNIRDYDIALRKFYTEQRDKHLQQLMAINGQGTFGTLAIVGAILIGGLGLKKDTLQEVLFKPLILWFVIIGIGIALLFTAAATFSFFHTTRIKRFEYLIQNPVEFNKFKDNEFHVMPKKAANYFVFFGLASLLIGVLGILLTIICKISG